MRKKPSTKKPSFKLTKGNVIGIVTALIAGTCTIIAACIGLATPIVSKYFEPPPTQTLTASPSPTTNIPTATPLINSARLEPIEAKLLSCSVGGIYAVPNYVEIPLSVSGSDPFERYNNAENYLNEQGFLVAAESVNSNGLDTGDPRTYAQACDLIFLSLYTILWNDSSGRIFVKEVALIVEAYDFEPSHIPNDYKTVVLIPPQLGGGGGGGDEGNPEPTPIPFQSFEGELRSTSNSFPFMSMSNNPPIIIESGTPVQFGVFLQVLNAGTYRVHLAFSIEDGKGKQIKLNSESFISKFALINNLDLQEIIPIDVR